MSLLDIINVSLGADCQISSPDETTSTELTYRYPFGGQLSDVSFWNRSLSANEVAELYADRYGYMVYVLAGQSNMAGRGDDRIAEDSDFSLHENKLYQYETANNIQTSTPYNIIGTTISRVTNTASALLNPLETGNMSLFGLWKTLADDIIQYTSMPWRKRVLFVPCAKGGTGFADGVWLNGTGYMYNITSKAMAEVLNPAVNTKNNLNVMVGFHWNQGEKDIENSNMNYKAHLMAAFSGWSLNVPKFDYTKCPIVLTEIGGNYYSEAYNTTPKPAVNMPLFINNILSNLPAEYPNMGIVRTKGMAGIYKTDKIHLICGGYRYLGHEHFDVWCRLSGGSRRKVDSTQQIMIFNPKNAKRSIQINGDVVVNGSISSSATVASNTVARLDSIDLQLGRSLITKGSTMFSAATNYVTWADFSQHYLVVLSSNNVLMYLPEITANGMANGVRFTINTVSDGTPGFNCTIQALSLGGVVDTNGFRSLDGIGFSQITMKSYETIHVHCAGTYYHITRSPVYQTPVTYITSGSSYNVIANNYSAVYAIENYVPDYPINLPVLSGTSNDNTVFVVKNVGMAASNQVKVICSTLGRIFNNNATSVDFVLIPPWGKLTFLCKGLYYYVM